MATIECVGVFATGFMAFRHARHIAALDLASWAGATVPTSAWERGHGGDMARVGVEHGVGLGLGLALGLDGWRLDGGLDAWALAWGGRGTPTPPNEWVLYVPVLNMPPPTIQPPKGPPGRVSKPESHQGPQVHGDLSESRMGPQFVGYGRSLTHAV